MWPTIIILLSCCMYFTAIDAQHQNPANLKYMNVGLGGSTRLAKHVRCIP